MTILAQLLHYSWTMNNKGMTQFSALLHLFAIICCRKPGNLPIIPEQISHCLITMNVASPDCNYVKCEHCANIHYTGERVRLCERVFVFISGRRKHVWTVELGGRKSHGLLRWYRLPLASTTQLRIFTAANTDLFINIVTWHWHMLEAVWARKKGTNANRLFVSAGAGVTLWQLGASLCKNTERS